MPYIKTKNSEWIIVNELGLAVTGSVEELLNHPAMIMTDAYEVVDAEAPIFITSRVIFEAPSE